MMKKTVIMISAVLTIACAVTLLAFAASPKENDSATVATVTEAKELKAVFVDPTQMKTSFDDTSFVDEAAQQEMTYIIGNVPVALTYEKTINRANGMKENVYLDSEGNGYYFGQSGELLESKMSDDNLSKANDAYVGDKAKPATMTQDEALAYAEKAARERFGSRFDLVEFDSVHQDSMDHSYSVYYYQKLGEDKYIQGVLYYANVLQDGSLYTCSMGNYDDLAGFDESLLDGVTEATIRASVEKELKNKYGDVIDYQINEPRLFYDNGNYYVGLGVSATIMDEEIGRAVPVGERLRYDLPAA
ncbi:MAG: hypothetical protein HFE78_02615 [Clostridiales bacterium]|nr:hypothetical protein [Clostridiales bacterium]